MRRLSSLWLEYSSEPYFFGSRRFIKRSLRRAERRRQKKVIGEY